MIQSVTRQLLIGSVALFILLVLSGCATAQADPAPTGEAYTFHGLQYDPVEAAPDFELFDHHGQPIRLSDFKGKLVLLYFGFLNCPDACPLTLSTWSVAYRMLTEENDGNDLNSDDLRFVFITVDPERDSPTLVRKHLDLFNTDFVGLWGTVDDVEDIARSYNVFMQKVDSESAAGYLVNHTTLTFVIDQNGQLVLAHQTDITPAELTADIKQLLQ
ncbi:MAG: SCO family protein [Chloroflexota bacterium]